ncbi:poly [ADP-ribose] polymerase 12-like, partial [Clarias magur]
MKVLCNNQCCLEFKKLNAFLRPSFTVDDQLLSRALLNGESFHVVDEKSTERALSPGALIIARTPLRVCKDPEKCARCEELHLCRYLVCGKCRFGLGPLPVDFSLMQCGGKRIRRLSTASSFTKPPHFILTTDWLWYWKNEKGKWIEYGKGEDKKTTTITSKSLENIYLSEIESEIPFSVGGNNYVLHIK